MYIGPWCGKNPFPDAFAWPETGGRGGSTQRFDDTARARGKGIALITIAANVTGCLAAQYLTQWIIESLAGAAAAEAALASIRPIGEGCVALPAALAKTLPRQGLTGRRQRAISQT